MYFQLPTPYGSFPTENISQIVTPNDQTSLLIGINSCRVNSSRAIHLIGIGRILSSFSFVVTEVVMDQNRVYETTQNQIFLHPKHRSTECYVLLNLHDIYFCLLKSPCHLQSNEYLHTVFEIFHALYCLKFERKNELKSYTWYAQRYKRVIL